MELQQSGKVNKGWGYEIVWSNNDQYCGKLLIFPTVGSKTSFLLHKHKKKSWFVNSGKFKMRFIDVTTGEVKEAILEEGKTVDLGEFSPHQLESLEANSVIFEVGTPDFVDDRIRISPGDTQLSEKQSNPTS